MKKKSRAILLTSLATIAVCTSIIAGATYALFTDEETVNIAVTSGRVAVKAYAQNLTGKTTYASTEGDGELYDESKLGDFAGYYKESGLTAETEKNGSKVVTFANGGTATLTAAGNVTLNNITPGDSVEFDIAIENSSNVATQYRTSMTAVMANEDSKNGHNLMSALNVTIVRDEDTVAYKLAEDRTDFSKMESYVSGWNNWESAKNGTDTYTLHVTISLPLTVGNDYKNCKSEITFKLEAVQGNSHVTGNEIFRYYEVSSVADLDNVIAKANASTNSVNIDLKNDITLVEPLTISASADNPSKVTYINLNNQTLTSTKSDDGTTAGTISVDPGAQAVIENGSIEQVVANTTTTGNKGKVPDKTVIEVINTDTDNTDAEKTTNVTIKSVNITTDVDTDNNFTSAIYVQGSTTKLGNASNVNVDIQDVTMTIGNKSTKDQIMTSGIWVAGYSTVNISGDKTSVNVNNAASFVNIGEYGTVNFSGGTIDVNAGNGQAFCFDSYTKGSEVAAKLNITGGTVNLNGDNESQHFSTAISATQEENLVTINGLTINCSSPKSQTIAIMSCGITTIDDITINITGDCTAGSVALGSLGSGNPYNYVINGGTFNINATIGKAYFMSMTIESTTETEGDYYIYNGDADGGNGKPMVIIKKSIVEAVQAVVNTENSLVNNWNISIYDFWALAEDD